MTTTELYRLPHPSGAGSVNPYDYAWAYVAALTGDPATAIIDWRALHDTDKSLPGHARRGTLPEMWPWLTTMNAQGYGVFCNVNALDGQGRELANVQSIRAHVVDLDNEAALVNFDRAAASNPHPSFAVETSPAKRHVYWAVQPYADVDRYQLLQRKLRQVYDGDRAVIDATRVMRVPGTWNLKRSPAHLVTCHSLPGYGFTHPVETIEAAYASVNVIDGGSGERRDLGELSLAAPSLDWLKYALQLIDPNTLDRGDWIAITSAFKQAGWSLADNTSLYNIWSEWCARYERNDVGENLKQWNSLRQTELGWSSLVRRVPSLQAAISFGGTQQASGNVQSAASSAASIPPMPEPPPLDCSGEFLTHIEQQEWFKGCTFVVKLGHILAPDGRLLNATQFNGSYGGKRFIITSNGKETDEAWKAALRSTMWTIPKVDHLRFLPHLSHGQIVDDALGRKGVNTYKPAIVERVAGDPAPFLWHIASLLPDAEDQRKLIEFLAHNVRFPGFKIPWAPVIQSTEGAGKGVIKAVMTHALGRPYVYFPNAKELTASGSQFNAWLKNKLFILADEIKVDDKRDLIEVLKPMISETVVEMQSKGIDQDLEDNFANWLFFTNYKDAVPISKNGRRYAVFFSALQTKQDKLDRGMDEGYYKRLYAWLLEGGGAQIVTHYLSEYPIERGAIPMDAPDTSSAEEAVAISRSPIERVIAEAIEEQLPGFRGGWISSIAAVNRVKAVGAVRGGVSPHVVASIAESLGYINSGRAPRAFFQEDKDQRAYLYHYGCAGDVAVYGRMQGWE